jgi:hypothetical protein
MALSILDGNQTATTLSTILSSGQHITAHTVVSLGTQAKTDILSAVSNGIAISGTVTANGGDFTALNGQTEPDRSVQIGFFDVYATGDFVRVNNDGNEFPVKAYGVDYSGAPRQIPVEIDSNVIGEKLIPIGFNASGEARQVSYAYPLPISGTVTIGSALPAGTNRIGVVTIGGGTVTIGAGTAQIGSVTASISGTVPVSILSVTIGNSVTVGSLPVLLSTTTIGGTARLNVTLSSAATPGSTAPSYANLYGGTDGTNLRAISVDTSGRSVVTGSVSIASLSSLVAGTAQIGSVTASISNSVVTFYPLQGTSISNTNFTSLTSSTSLVSAVANREVLTVFNEGAGNLHISAGATCTTISYQVRLSAGDYWECPQGQLSLAHTAVFATAGTARVSQIS